MVAGQKYEDNDRAELDGWPGADGRTEADEEKRWAPAQRSVCGKRSPRLRLVGGIVRLRL